MPFRFRKRQPVKLCMFFQTILVPLYSPICFSLAFTRALLYLYSFFKSFCDSCTLHGWFMFCWHYLFKPFVCTHFFQEQFFLFFWVRGLFTIPVVCVLTLFLLTTNSQRQIHRHTIFFYLYFSGFFSYLLFFQLWKRQYWSSDGTGST